MSDDLIAALRLVLDSHQSFYYGNHVMCSCGNWETNDTESPARHDGLHRTHVAAKVAEIVRTL